jgi:site-specific recombinase XerD
MCYGGLVSTDPASLLPEIPAGWTRELEIAGTLVGGKRNRNTAEAYARDLRLFFGWCHGRALPPFAARRPDIDRWVEALEARGDSTATILRRLSAVQQFYEEAEAEELIVRAPTRRVERPKLEREPSLGISRAQANRLLEVAAEAGSRESALVSVLLLSGVRVSPVCAMRVRDFGRTHDRPVITVTEKRSKTRRVPLAPPASAAIERHLRERGGPGDDEPLIARADGRALDRFEAGRIMRKLGRLAGLPPHLRSCHELKHTFVTLSLAAGVPLEVVQESAGHVDPKTTFGYKRVLENLDRHATFRLAEWLEVERPGDDRGHPRVTRV